ncbi:MAG: CDP-glycerol glycerophosphotransferase family protein, partial [Helicobacter sp.]|nr:CDP-glycerol glycerophosphotransferase family protein [Helicobacter sp.]
PDNKDIESIRINGKEVFADYQKIIKNDFLERVFSYEKRLWVHIPKNSYKLEVFIRGQRAKITFNGKQYQSLELWRIHDKFQQVKQNSDLWLLMDRDIKADDNAEHLYRYIATNYPHQNIIFALRKDSEDWKRLENDGFKLVKFGSQKFKKALKTCQKVVSSHIDSYLTNYLGAKTLKDKDFIFLQHGVTKDDISNWINPKKIHLFIASCLNEYNSLTKDFTHYKIGLKEVKLTGFARADALLAKEREWQKQANKKRQILIMPTWRKYLVGETTGFGNDRKYNLQLLESKYFKKWKSFLNNQKLRDFCQRYNFKILFNPHQDIMPYINSFLCDFIQLKSKGDSLQKLFIESTLMITDYSSVAFDMAYLKKPVLYYQFDEEEFFSKHWQSGYFDYRKDGFGPVVTTEEELFKGLEILLQNDCKVGEPYRSNIENTFEFRDGKCCERIYKEILELDKPYERKWTLDSVLRLAQDSLKSEFYKEASERFRFVLEHLGESEFSNTQVILSEEIIFNYLYASRLNQTSQMALEFIKTKDYENKLAFSNKVKLEIIKNYIEIRDVKEMIARVEDLTEVISQQELLEFAYLKLRIYACLGDKQKLKEVHSELKDAYNIDNKDLDLDLFLFQNELIKA